MTPALHLETRGRGPYHLLFTHGWMSSRRMWYEVADLFDPTQYTLHLLDFHGSGLSSRTTERHTLEGYAQDARQALSQLAPNAVLAVGHSAGGKILQYVASHRPPPNLHALALVAPGTAAAYPANPRHRQRTEEAYGSPERIRTFILASMSQPVPEPTLKRLIEDALQSQREAWMGWYDHGRTTDFSQALSMIRIPTLILGGTQDAIATPERLRTEVADKIAQARLQIIPGAGHNLPVEAPQAVAQALAQFAQQHLGRPR
jgi:pimeloyl-ACP methyl ester carboxylesterase